MSTEQCPVPGAQCQVPGDGAAISVRGVGKRYDIYSRNLDRLG